MCEPLLLVPSKELVDFLLKSYGNRVLGGRTVANVAVGRAAPATCCV